MLWSNHGEDRNLTFEIPLSAKQTRYRDTCTLTISVGDLQSHPKVTSTGLGQTTDTRWASDQHHIKKHHTRWLYAPTPSEVQARNLSDYAGKAGTEVLLCRGKLRSGRWAQ